MKSAFDKIAAGLADATAYTGGDASRARKASVDVKAEGAMTTDQERWAEAIAIERQHGSDAARWIAERVGSLALAGDEEGIARFREIAARLDQLLAGRAQ